MENTPITNETNTIEQSVTEQATTTTKHTTDNIGDREMENLQARISTNPIMQSLTEQDTVTDTVETRTNNTTNNEGENTMANSQTTNEVNTMANETEVQETAEMTETAPTIYKDAITEKESKELAPVTTEDAEVVETDIVEQSSSTLPQSIASYNNFTMIPSLIQANTEIIELKKSRAYGLKNNLNHLCDGDLQEEMTNNLLDNYLIDYNFVVTPLDQSLKPDTIYNLIIQYKEINIQDLIDPTKTAKLSHNNFMDLKYETEARGGETYRGIFTRATNMVSTIRAIGQKYLDTCNGKYLSQATAECAVLSELPKETVAEVIKPLKEYDYLQENQEFKTEMKKFAWSQKNKNLKVSEDELKSLYLCKDYAVVNIKGKILFMDMTDPDLTKYTKANLKDKFAPYCMWVVEEGSERAKKKNPVDIYLESKYRKEFDKIGFYPGGAPSDRIFNLYKGYKYQPQTLVDITLFKEFVWEVICKKDQDKFNYVWSFIAQMIQNPGEKIGSAMVMTGKKGCGKSSFVYPLGKLMEGYYMCSADNKRLLGEFNEHLEKVILYYANEANFTNTVNTENKLKNKVTETESTTEIKNGDTYATKNYTRIIIDNNDFAPVRHSYDERRFCHLDVADDRVGDHEYFDSLYELYETPGFYESLMYEFMNFDYTPHIHLLRKPPVTENTQEQIKLNMKAIEAWWMYCLEEGKIPYVQYDLTPDDGLNITNEAKYESFKKWCSKFGYKCDLNLEMFGKEFVRNALCDMRDLEKAGKITINGKRLNSKLYAELPKCREIFFKSKGINNSEYVGDEWQVS